MKIVLKYGANITDECVEKLWRVDTSLSSDWDFVAGCAMLSCCVRWQRCEKEIVGRPVETALFDGKDWSPFLLHPSQLNTTHATLTSKTPVDSPRRHSGYLCECVSLCVSVYVCDCASVCVCVSVACVGFGKPWLVPDHRAPPPLPSPTQDLDLPKSRCCRPTPCPVWHQTLKGLLLDPVKEHFDKGKT